MVNSLKVQLWLVISLWRHLWLLYLLRRGSLIERYVIKRDSGWYVLQTYFLHQNASVARPPWFPNRETWILPQQWSMLLNWINLSSGNLTKTLSIFTRSSHQHPHHFLSSEIVAQVIFKLWKTKPLIWVCMGFVCSSIQGLFTLLEDPVATVLSRLKILAQFCKSGKQKCICSVNRDQHGWHPSPLYTWWIFGMVAYSY